MIDLAPAYATIGVFYDPTRFEIAGTGQSPFDLLKTKIETILAKTPRRSGTKIRQKLTDIPVCYGGEFGPDLADVARSTAGLEESEVIRRHSHASTRWPMSDSCRDSHS